MARRSPPTLEQLTRKLDSMRPPSPTEPPSAPVRLEQDEITGVIHLALERVAVASASGMLEAAARRLLRESSATLELARSLSPPSELASATMEPDPNTDGT